MKYLWPFALLGILLTFKFWFIAIPLILFGVVVGWKFRELMRRNKNV